MTSKILHIAPFFHGGVGNVSLNLTKALAKIGCEVILAAPTKIPSELREFVTQYHTLRAPTLKDPFYVIQFYSLNRVRIESTVKLEKPDALLTHGPLVLATKFIRDIPIISVVHGTYANEIRWMWQHPMFGFDRVRYITGIYASYRLDMELYKYVTKSSNIYLVAVSKNTRRELIEVGIHENKVSPILNGVDKERFKPMNKDFAKTMVEEMFRIRLRNKALLHVNPGPRKGTHILIKAFAILKRIYGEDLMLLIVGRLGPKTYREYVEKLIRSLDLERNVVMLGYVENEKLPILYNAADLTVVPSYSEGGPLITPESLACGTPVVATNVGGSPEYLNLVHLNELLISIDSYDFSHALACKCVLGMSRGYRVNHAFIPSWKDVVRSLINIVNKITI